MTQRSIAVDGFRGYALVHQLLATLTVAGGSTLEIGCGAGFYRPSVRGSYVGSDVTASPYHPGMPRTVDVICSGTALPFVSASFDLIFSVAAIDYLPDLEAAARESRRTLRPGGRVLVVTYGWWTLRRIHRIDARRRDGRDPRDDPHHHQVFTPLQLRRLFERHRFRVRFLDASEPQTPWKRSLLRLPLVRLARRWTGHWLVLLGETE